MVIPIVRICARTFLVPSADFRYVAVTDVKTAKTLKEASELIEAGFEYVTDMDHCKLFRKPK